ncbi:MAG: hypothetical protein PHH54_02495 [Candidatus Nanoarchaeia archaeon]|nr:hypothetical protein [Candidatus Nanoarchaeia archaeon]MDD5740831.1 hypothetical protein [Candidatus Nanoarchaeia archaeon]
MAIYVPPTYDRTDDSLIFLAGPIQGALRWQNKAAELIEEIAPELNIASPRYIGEDQKIIGDYYPEEKPHSQIDWETYHLNKAGEKGVVLFWLAKESIHFCNRAFAQASRNELGRWEEKNKNRKSKVVVGIEDGFSGKGYIEYTLSTEYPNIPVLYNLEETCQKSIELCNK